MIFHRWHLLASRSEPLPICKVTVAIKSEVIMSHDLLTSAVTLSSDVTLLIMVWYRPYTYTIEIWCDYAAGKRLVASHLAALFCLEVIKLQKHNNKPICLPPPFAPFYVTLSHCTHVVPIYHVLWQTSDLHNRSVHPAKNGIKANPLDL